MTDPTDPPVDGVDGKRQRARDSLLLMAELQLGGETRIREGRVRNLSEGGLMIELDKAVEVGTSILLRLRGIGEVSGKIAWYTAGRAGVALDVPIDPKMARKPVGPRPEGKLFEIKAP
ncbi:PilZ domain-containing protein [Sphingomonas sp. OK281]|uniref:PilZ domain-containing protein n=1 Tax=Sphingomonas sp. OK281 TaxID=1881067 RepID=UPI000B81DD67|nr:PilZ domain-containing protein [Sphingomonas sp. OK281]